jgi:hypothetical protein
MKMSRPPRAAAWLLEYLVPGRMNDALAGDLQEEFGRRGAVWYWRQVLLAIIVGFFRHLRKEWVSIAYAFGWLYATEEIIRRVYSRMSTGPKEAWWIGWPWPFSLAAEIAREVCLGLIPLILGLAIYLVLSRRFSLRGFTAGTAVSTGALVAGDVGMTLWRGNGFHLAWFVEALLYMLALLAGIWAGQRRRLHASLS